LAVVTQSPVALFEFRSGIEGQAEQDCFKEDFARELERLEQWSAEHDWLSFKRAVPNLTVVVSERFNISKSLVPAWNGWAGHMEFPARRVLASKAAVLHELVHVFFPSGNRFLAEGLAVHLQAEIGGNPAFPNFGAPLHALAGERMRDMAGQLVTDRAAGFKPAWLHRKSSPPSDLASSTRSRRRARSRCTLASISRRGATHGRHASIPSSARSFSF
jgi:hypothetical protein